MRILWWSNHPTAPTGYGQQTALWTRQLRDHGHDVVISVNYGGEPRAHHWEDIPVFPPGLADYATDSLQEDVRAVEPDLAFLLYDAWAIKAEPLPCRTAVWTPVDHEPLPPQVKSQLNHLMAQPVGMSKWGTTQLAGNGFLPLYVPHGINTDIYEPHDRREARRRLNLPEDAFLVGMVAANKGKTFLRKGFDVAFEAFGHLARAHDDAHLYVHSHPTAGWGTDLHVLASNYDLPTERVTFANPALLRYGITDVAMSWIYSAFDVLLSPSLGEGFGIPVIEAQACGVPVIVTDATAQSELCGAGWKVPGHWLYDATQLADWVRPYDALLKQALHDAYDARGDEKLAADARTFGESYDYRQVWDEFFAPVLGLLVPDTSPIVVP